MPLRLLILLCYFFFSVAYAATESVVTVSDLKGQKNFELEILEDPTRSLTPEQLMHSQGWQTSDNHLSLGYSKSDYWLRFTLHNPQAQAQNYRLNFSEAFMRDVYLYQQRAGTWQPSLNGLSVSLHDREVKNPFPTFNLRLDPHSDTPLLLKINSDYGLFGAVLVMDEADYIEHLGLKDSIHSFVFGAILIMLLYNACIWIRLRDKLYFFYVAYALCYFGWLTAYSGHYLHFVPQELYKYTNIFLQMAAIFLIFFSRHLLDVGKHFPLLNKLLLAMAVAFGVSIVVLLLDTQAGFKLQTQLAVILMPLLLLLGFMSMAKRVANSKTYTSALVLYYAGLMVLALLSLGVLDYSSLHRYAPLPGSLVELVLFSIALASRINYLREVALASQAKLLTLQKNINIELELKVEERTRDLREQTQNLEALSRLDGLTGISNRRAFREDLDAKMAGLEGEGCFMLLMLDIDHFKLYNDSYGHLAGDDALKIVASILQTCAHSERGQAYRLGGEEFAVLSLSSSLEAAGEQAEIIREAVIRAAIKHESSLTGVMTASLGVMLVTDAKYYSLSEIYNFADEAMYQAKKSGRNQWVIAEQSLCPKALSLA